MCSQSVMLYQPMSIQMMLAVLCTSRFGGFSVWTDPEKAKTDVETTESDKLLSDIGEDHNADTLEEVFMTLGGLNEEHS